MVRYLWCSVWAVLFMWFGGPSHCFSSIIIENAELRLVISEDGTVESLVHKPSGQECIMPDTDAPAFALVQDRPYINELQLGYPSKRTIFSAKSVQREHDRLIVRFASVDNVLTIRIKITNGYIAFNVEKIEGSMPVDEITFMQLPIRARTNFGDWLNVVWDRDVAINLLGTDPAARIDSETRRGYYLLQAAAANDVQQKGVGAALITSAADRLLDRIQQVELDFHLPNGVKSREREEQRWSYYWTADVTPQNVTEHIHYARQAGFHAMLIYYGAFSRSAGHFPWRPEYPNGISDLKAVTDAIKRAGMLVGVHIHYSKTCMDDPYVTPIPDDRLNLLRTFTLAAPIDANADTITVWENPDCCVLDEERARTLKIGTEIVTYERYTATPPYQFIGCKRGQWKTRALDHDKGLIFGLLDVDMPNCLRLNLNTDIEKEVAERIAAIYSQAGFQFVYFDGAEDVHRPYWYMVSKAQWEVYRLLQPEPLFAEGACKSHFSWHMLNRGNAFDIFKPESMKEATRQHPAAEAGRIAQDFTTLNFGWMGYWVPDATTVGTQPDMVEYLTSRAAAWDSPISIQAGLDKFKSHPRTADNLEVIRRWEEVRYRNWLNDRQKVELRKLEQEHILLINEKGEFELVPYDQIENVASGSRDIRAFIFERASKTFVVYWHASGEANLDVPLQGSNVRLLSELYGEQMPVRKSKTGIVLPASGRRYLECNGLSRIHVIRAFQTASVIGNK